MPEQGSENLVARENNIAWEIVGYGSQLQTCGLCGVLLGPEEPVIYLSKYRGKIYGIGTWNHIDCLKKKVADEEPSKRLKCELCGVFGGEEMLAVILSRQKINIRVHLRCLSEFLAISDEQRLEKCSKSRRGQCSTVAQVLLFERYGRTDDSLLHLGKHKKAIEKKRVVFHMDEQEIRDGYSSSLPLFIQKGQLKMNWMAGGQVVLVSYDHGRFKIGGAFNASRWAPFLAEMTRPRFEQFNPILSNFRGGSLLLVMNNETLDITQINWPEIFFQLFCVEKVSVPINVSALACEMLARHPGIFGFDEIQTRLASAEQPLDVREALAMNPVISELTEAFLLADCEIRVQQALKERRSH